MAEGCLGSGTGLTIVGEGVPQGDQVTWSLGAKTGGDLVTKSPTYSCTDAEES